MKKYLALILALSAVLLGASACGSSADDIANQLRQAAGLATSAPAETPAPTASPDESGTAGNYNDPAWSNKYNAYIDYSNYVQGPLWNTIMVYVDIFGSDDAFVAPDESADLASLKPLVQSDYDVITTAQNAAYNDSISFGDLDGAALQSASMTKTFMDVYNEVSAYYSGGQYSDDDYAQGQGPPG